MPYRTAFWKSLLDVTSETFASLLAQTKKIQVEGWSVTLTFLPLSVCAWSADRSTAISCEPRPTLSSCVAATMLRTTTLDHGDFIPAQYLVFGVSVICEVVL